MTKDKVYIIGVAPAGISSLEATAQQLINEAEIVIGGRRLLDSFPSLKAEKVPITNNLSGLTELIKKNIGQKRIVVLASGDPDFYGIGSYLTSSLGKDVIEILPNVSSMQLAFARIKESWDDAVFVSVHSRPIENIIDTVRTNWKIGIFTDEKHNPGAIATALLKHGINEYRAYVCQDLGEKHEKIIETDLHGLCTMKFSPLNILILISTRPDREEHLPSPRLLGIPDEEFYQQKRTAGRITKQEVRAISLAKMCLREESVLWDIGAGSGAVSIEASFLARKGSIYAVEKNDADIAIIKKNIRKFNTHNIEVIQTVAPDNLDHLPDPDTIFIGGSGGRMEGIIEFASRKLKPGGRIVINIALLENLGTTVETLKAKGFTPEITMVNIARSTGILELTRFDALNPVFIVTGVRDKGGIA
jgi:precorrin-6Y C5,15-methyltransferase (decarboxylating)